MNCVKNNKLPKSPPMLTQKVIQIINKLLESLNIYDISPEHEFCETL